MQQILNFTIDIFDVRTNLSIKIKDDSSLVRSIKIQKNTALDNQAVITFAKADSYRLLQVEEQMKLYNYVKIKLTLKNYDTGEENKTTDFYFSGFIQNINKNISYGTSPSASVSITIVDFANLFKTTFYTKNLTFVQILQQAVPEFRLINFGEIFNDPQNKILNTFYSLNQMGFIFFSFFFFKFLYNIVYDKPGEAKMAGTDPIFKQFKLFMPFGFDLLKEDESKTTNSIFKNQVSSLIIYKQLQGVALDLFKYVYPEPIFEFTTHETADSVILQIRLTPFMSFSRDRHNSIKLQYGDKVGLAEDAGEDLYRSKEINLEGSILSINDYKVIDEEDFGHLRVNTMYQETTASVADQIRMHLNPIMKMMDDTLLESRKLDVGTFIPDNRENDELVAAYFNEIPFDIRFLETINMTRSSQNVVNVIWTVPTTDTAVLQSSGRSIVYGVLTDRLKKLGGGKDNFKLYIGSQFVENKQPNPAFFWNYQDMYPDKYVSGDLNYFGFREFEIKWNCLTVYDFSVYHVLNYIDKKMLEEIRKASKDDKYLAMVDNALVTNVQKIDSITDSTGKIVANTAPMKTIGVFYEKAFEDADFKESIKLLGYSEEKYIKEIKAADIVKFILDRKDAGALSIGDFASKLNGIIARSYRENEHLYDCQILTPINLSILPGMIVDSKYPNYERYNSPRFKGYVTGIMHTIDFMNATMKSNFTLNRTALEDSALVIKTDN